MEDQSKQPLVLHRYVRRPKSSRTMYDAKSKKNVRVGGRSNAQRGVVVALVSDGQAFVGWSLCNEKAGDIYNKRQGYQLALGMASQLMIDQESGVIVGNPAEHLVDTKDDRQTLPILQKLVKDQQIPHSVYATLRDHISYVLRRSSCKRLVIGTGRSRQLKSTNATPLPASKLQMPRATKSKPSPSTKKPRTAAQLAAGQKAAETRRRNRAALAARNKNGK